MTVREYFEDWLVSSGLLANQAKKVLDVVVASEPGKVMSGRWNDNVDSYKPTPVLRVITAHVRRETLKWIDANAPDHWARVLFV